MSEEEVKKARLTFKRAHLRLNNSKEGLIKKTPSIGSDVKVELKPAKAGIFPENKLASSKSTNQITNAELDKRLDLLKKTKEADIEKLKIRENPKEEVKNIQEDIKKEKKLENKEQENQKVKDPQAKQTIQKNEILPKENHSKLQEKAEDVNKKLAPNFKQVEQKKLKKSDIIQMMSEDEREYSRTRSQAAIKRAKEKEKRKNLQNIPREKIYREVIIPEHISVEELASRMSERSQVVIKELMKLGIIAATNKFIDADTAELIATTLGHTVKRTRESEVEDVFTEEITDNPEDLKSRPPIVTIMGHVDHGKTSLLDALKSTDVASTEAGGITQHIGAYHVNLNSGKTITFLDTPGHEAFTEMRMRGAKLTDIVVLVVAADDGIKAQTIEAISHAKAAQVPIIVAVNKIDKEDANQRKVIEELLAHDMVAEEYGGEVMVVPISAKKRQNLDKLEEAILLQAEILDLKTNYTSNPIGVVIESKIDKGKGVSVSLIPRRGVLKLGDIVVAGSSYGKIKRIFSDKGGTINQVDPCEPVEVLGFDTAPLAGEKFTVVTNEKQARDITEYRKNKSKEINALVKKPKTMDEIFNQGESSQKELSLVVKADVHGSREAIIASLEKFNSEKVKINILHSAVGGVTESDVILAKASNAPILGFNVRAGANAREASEKHGVDINYYSIIYELIDEVKQMIQGVLDPIRKESFAGNAEVREVFNITGSGKIAGCYVTKGNIGRNMNARIIRSDVVIYTGNIKTIKRFKEDQKEVKEGYECGISIENYDDLKVGDIIEAFEVKEQIQEL